MSIHHGSTAEELSNQPITSAKIRKSPSIGGVRLYLIYPGPLGASDGTGLNFSSEDEAAAWFGERFPLTELERSGEAH